MSIRVTLIGEDKRNLRDDLTAMGADISLEPYDPEKLLEPFESGPQVIICLRPPTGITETEVAQSIRMNYPDIQLLFVTYERTNYNKRLLVKNGFSDTFFLPWEIYELRKVVTSECQMISNPEMKGYVAISPEDLFKDSTLSFPIKIHLSMNNKFVQYAHEDEVLSSDKLERLKLNNVTQLYIHADDQVKFEDYVKTTASRVSTSTRRKHLCEINRELVAEILVDDQHEKTFDKSRELMNKVKELVKMILQDNKISLREKMISLGKKEHSFYNHLTNVCAYAGYFSQAMGHASPEDIAIAGLFHDIGKLIPAPEDSSPEDWSKYHQDRTIDLLKSRRMVLTDLSQKAILQHHETLDGKGFPKNLSAAKISTESRILAIANSLDHLTSFTNSKKALSFDDALEQLIQENTQPTGARLDPDLLKKLKSLTRG